MPLGGTRGVVLAIAFALLATGCGGSKSGGGDLPSPPSGKATVGGKLLVNKQPRAAEYVSLTKKIGKKSGGEKKAKTDAAGKFVFEGVEPGTYVLSIGLFIEGKIPESQTTPIDINGPCSSSAGDLLVAYGTSKKTGKEGFVVTPMSPDEFTIEAGDRTTRDLVFTCKT